MKLSVFVFSMLLSFGYQDSIPDTINKYIEELRDAIPEPIVIDTINPDLSDNEYVDGYFNVNNLNIQGLKAFNANITYLLGIFPTHFVLTIDAFDLDADYLFDVNFLNLSLLHLYGEGNTSMELTNLTVEGDFLITVVPLNISIYGMQMHLDSAKFKIDGLLNDDNYSNRLSDLLSENIANIFNDQEYGLSLLIEDALNKAIADIISSNPTLSESYNDFTRKDPEVAIQSVAELLFSVLSALSETDHEN